MTRRSAAEIPMPIITQNRNASNNTDFHRKSMMPAAEKSITLNKNAITEKTRITFNSTSRQKRNTGKDVFLLKQNNLTIKAKPSKTVQPM